MRSFEVHVQIDVGDETEETYETDEQTMEEIMFILEDALYNYTTSIDIYPTDNADY